MHVYCRAYPLADLRQFSGWTDGQTAQLLSDDTICYLWDDFSVVLSPIQVDSLIFDGATPDWQKFCQTTLQFTVPDEIANYR